MISIEQELKSRRKGWCCDCGLAFGDLVERAEWPDSNTCVDCLARIPVGLRGQELYSEIDSLESTIDELNRQIEDIESERDGYVSILCKLRKELDQVRRVGRKAVR